MRVLEMLNAYPGETFIREHANAILQDKRITLGWAFWQISRTGALAPPVKGLEKCMGLFNSNRSSALKKSIVKLKHLNRHDSYKRELIRQVRSFKPDLVHFQFASLAVQHLKTFVSAGIPFTFSIRGSDLLVTPKTNLSFVDKLKEAIAHARGIHVVSNHLKEALFDYAGPNDKTKVIMTTVSQRWSGLRRSDNPKGVVAIGRLHWVKAYSDLILAVRILAEKGIVLNLKIIGEGEQRDLIQYMIRDLKLTDRVECVGRLSQDGIRNILADAEGLVISSVSEGFPNVAVEAMLARVPVIATHHAMLQEVFEPGVEFLQTETGNPASLANALMNFHQLNDVERKAMTDRAYNCAASQFNYARHADEFCLFWSEAIKNTL